MENCTTSSKYIKSLRKTYSLCDYESAKRWFIRNNKDDMSYQSFCAKAARRIGI